MNGNTVYGVVIPAGVARPKLAAILPYIRK
jgi:hypothetical protein